MRMLEDAHLFAAVLPELPVLQRAGHARVLDQPAGQRALAALDRLPEPSFSLALAALLAPFVDASAAAGICRRWRLSNRDSRRCVWLVEQQRALIDARRQPWPRLQRILIHPGTADLLALHIADSAADAADVEFCRDWLARPRAELDPPPLVTGDDLVAHGIPPGKHFQKLLDAIRDAQLDHTVRTPDEALALAKRLWRP